jgi:hypothetical protein
MPKKEINEKKISILNALALPKYITISSEEWEQESREENEKHFKKLDNELSSIIKRNRRFYEYKIR